MMGIVILHVLKVIVSSPSDGVVGNTELKLSAVVSGIRVMSEDYQWVPLSYGFYGACIELHLTWNVTKGIVKLGGTGHPSWYHARTHKFIQAIAANWSYA